MASLPPPAANLSTSTTEPKNPSSKKPKELIFAPSSSNVNTAAPQFHLSTLSLSHLSPSPLTQFHTWFTAAQSATQLPIPHPETTTLSTASLPSGRVSARMVYLKTLDTRGFVFYSNFGTSRKSRDLGENRWASMVFWWEGMERQVRIEGRVEMLFGGLLGGKGPGDRERGGEGREEEQRYFDMRGRGSRIGAWASPQSRVLVPRRLQEEKRPDRADVTGGDAKPHAVAPGGPPEGHSLPGKEGLTGEEKGDKPHAVAPGGPPEGHPLPGKERSTGEVQEEDDGRTELEQRVKEVEARFDGVEQIPVPDFWGGARLVPERVEFWQGRDSRLHDRFLYTRLDAITDGDEKGEEDDEEKWEWKIDRLAP